MPVRRFTVALTGGIASGKSTVANRFAALGANVVDADVIARELVEPGSEALAEIVHGFGADVLTADGALDRRSMRERVFADADARRRLEAILHPRVRDALLERANDPVGPYAMLVIPLLAESGDRYAWVDRTLVVDAPREQQLARIVARDSVDHALAEAMIGAQASRDQRLGIADDVIVNDGTPEQLDANVAALHRHYLELADLRRRGG